MFFVLLTSSKTTSSTTICAASSSQAKRSLVERSYSNYEQNYTLPDPGDNGDMD